jgi:hypothetical protein
MSVAGSSSPLPDAVLLEGAKYVGPAYKNPDIWTNIADFDAGTLAIWLVVVFAGLLVLFGLGTAFMSVAGWMKMKAKGEETEEQEANRKLLSKSASYGKTGDYLKYDATDAQKKDAQVVFVIPVEEREHDDPIHLARLDMLARITKSGLTYSSMFSFDKDEVFILIDAPQDRLKMAADFAKHDMRLKKGWEVPFAPFTMDREQDFRWEDAANNILFHTRDKHTLIYNILEYGTFDTIDEMEVNYYDQKMWSDKYGTEKLPTCGLNLTMLVDQGVLTEHYAMHGRGRRFELLSQWSLKFWDQQPLEMIFEYFNSKIALHFAFIGHYSMWLLITAIPGAVLFVYNHFIGPATEVYDNKYTVIFTFIVTMWGTLWIEFWKRYNAELSYRWSTIDLLAEARERPEYSRGCENRTAQGFYTNQGSFVPYTKDIDPKPSFITKMSSIDCFGSIPLSWEMHEEPLPAETQKQIDALQDTIRPLPYMDMSTRAWRERVSGVFNVFFLLMILSMLMSFLVMRLVFQQEFGAFYGTYGATFLQSFVSVLLNLVFMEIGVIFVDWENYRTNQEWESALVKKVFPVQFVNYFFTLAYIAFIKGHIGHLAGMDDYCLNNNGTRADSCMGELNKQLLSTVLMHQLMSLSLHAGKPYVQYKLQIWADELKFKMNGGSADDMVLSEIGKEAKLMPVDELDSFNDYNKYVIQFGVVTMFASAFPLAPFCAMFCNMIELRTDAYRRLMTHQRPSPSARAENIGAWIPVLEFMSLVSVATNAGVICFTAHEVPKQFGLETWGERLLLFIIVEHVVLFTKLFVMTQIDDRPEWVNLRLARDAFMMSERKEMIAKEEADLDDLAKLAVTKIKEKTTSCF